MAAVAKAAKNEKACIDRVGSLNRFICWTVSVHPDKACLVTDEDKPTTPQPW
jgi:hypothetical protein